MCCLQLQTGTTRAPRPTQSTFCKLVFYGRHATLGKWVVKFTNHKPVASTCPTLCRVKSNFQSDQQKKLSGRKGGRASDRGGSKNDCADENDDATQSVSLPSQQRSWCRTTTNPRINTKHLRSSCFASSFSVSTNLNTLTVRHTRILPGRDVHQLLRC